MVRFLKKPNYFFIILIVALAIDQLTKYFASKVTESIPVIQNIFHITFVQNKGIIFGILPGFSGIIVWLYLVVLGLLVYFHNEFPKDRFSRIMLALVFAGVVGNFIDRILFGYVIDFFDFRIWPVFNMADTYLNVGVIGIIGKSVIDNFKKK